MLIDDEQIFVDMESAIWEPPEIARGLGIELLMKPYGMRQMSDGVRKVLNARKKWLDFKPG